MEHIKYTEILNINKQLAGTLTSKPYEIAILSNVTVNSIKEIIEYTSRINQIEPSVELGNFDNIVQDSIRFKNKDLIIIFYDTLSLVDQLPDFFEDLEEEMFNNFQQKVFNEIDIIFENLKQSASVIFNSFSSSYFIHNHIHGSKIDKFVRTLNEYVDTHKNTNTFTVQMDSIFIKTGIQQAIDYRFYHSSKAPYTFLFLKNYVSAIESILLRNTGKLKKAIIFDCDNTLWKGIIGEDGIDGIDMSPSSKTGKFYQYVQRIAVYLSKKGVIVGICSKNNHDDVLDVLKNHKDMILNEEHISIMKINWHDKVSNLKSIAQELNIGIDSLVFVDDSDFEINLINENIPEIYTIQVPKNIIDYPTEIITKANKLFNLVANTDDTKKTEMYKQQISREQSKNTFLSIDDYLASLEIELTVEKNNKSHIQRIAQLTQKTNQFNLTTKRYTESQIEQFMKDDQYDVYVMFVKDKFGDNGLTGVCIVQKDNNETQDANIDTLLMSCRIIGRNIEIVFLEYIIRANFKNGFEKIRSSYIRTPKNEQVSNFYEKTGFNIISDVDGSKKYVLDISNFQPKNLEYIKIKTENT